MKFEGNNIWGKSVLSRLFTYNSVSYTHLDVYKRQLVMRSDFCFLIRLIEIILNIANLSEFLSTI